jgi:cell division protein FtsW
VQKAFCLPEAHTDMIAAVIGEEVGMLGISVLVGLYSLFGYAGFRTAQRTKSRYEKLLVAGLTCLVLGQAAINLFAVMGMAPLTGVPLPFVSYGNSSLIVMLASAGLILNVASRLPATSRAARPAADGPRLRVLEGGRAKAAGRSTAAARSAARQRRRAASGGNGGHSRGGHGRARRAGSRRSRRASGQRR